MLLLLISAQEEDYLFSDKIKKLILQNLLHANLMFWLHNIIALNDFKAKRSNQI
jgi:hypothetical protein